MISPRIVPVGHAVASRASTSWPAVLLIGRGFLPGRPATAATEVPDHAQRPLRLSFRVTKAGSGLSRLSWSPDVGSGICRATHRGGAPAHLDLRQGEDRHEAAGERTVGRPAWAADLRAPPGQARRRAGCPAAGRDPRRGHRVAARPVWPGTRTRNGRLKNQGGRAPQCPLCGVSPRPERCPATPAVTVPEPDH